MVGITVYNLVHLGMFTVSVMYKKGRNKTSKAFGLTSAQTLDNFTGSSQVWTESTGKLVYLKTVDVFAQRANCWIKITFSNKLFRICKAS